MTRIRTPIDFIRRLPEVGDITKTVDVVVRKRQQFADLLQQIGVIEREALSVVKQRWTEEEINTALREQRDADEADDMAASPANDAIKHVAAAAIEDASRCVALAAEAVQELCR